MTDAPIKDTQAPGTAGHGVLDGQDLIKQMLAEEQAGSRRTPEERVHGVLEQAGARAISREVLQQALAALGRGETSLDGVYADAAARLTSNLQRNIDAIKKVMDNPAALKQMFDNLEQSMIKQNVPEAQRAVAMADARSMVDFVRTFDKTFPQGIKLEAKDMHGVLSHFGALPMLLPRTA